MYVYLREERSHHTLDPKYTGPLKVNRRRGIVVWIWRNGRLEPHKLDRVIAAGQLERSRSSSDSKVAFRSHEFLDTPGGTRDTEGSRLDVASAGSPTGFVQTSGSRLRRPGRWDDFVMFLV